jgi:hypothetical protein
MRAEYLADTTAVSSAESLVGSKAVHWVASRELPWAERMAASRVVRWEES